MANTQIAAKDKTIEAGSSGLRISEVQVFPLKEADGKLKAFAKVVLNGDLLLSSLRIYDSVNGLFVSFPADLNHKGEDYRHYYYPISKEFKQLLQDTVLRKYESILIEGD